MALERDEGGRVELPDWPRLMSERLPAAYLSIGTTSLRADGPAPVRLGRRVLYDRKALDAWADQLGREQPDPAPVDAVAVEAEFLKTRGRRRRQQGDDELAPRPSSRFGVDK
jgi:hypothetical protein